MSKRKILDLQYAVALLFAPVFCFLYIKIYQEQNNDIFWLFSDIRSLFFLIFLYPIVEELIFRGLIQEYIERKTHKITVFKALSWANIFTSLLFVLMHLAYHSPIWAMLVFFPSLVFGYFKERYEHIIPSIVLHSFYNLWHFSIIGI